MSCMSGSPNLNSFRDRGQVAVQLVSCWVLPPGLVEDCTQHSCVIAIKFLLQPFCYNQKGYNLLPHIIALKRTENMNMSSLNCVDSIEFPILPSALLLYLLLYSQRFGRYILHPSSGVWYWIWESTKNLWIVQREYMKQWISYLVGKYFWVKSSGDRRFNPNNR